MPTPSPAPATSLAALRRFDLRLAFALAAFLIITGISVLFGFLQARNIRAVLTSESEVQALVSASNLAFAVHHDFVEPILRDGRAIDLAEEDQVALLDGIVRPGIAASPVTKVNIFDERGTVIYSTDPSTIGREAAHHSHVNDALEGLFSSELHVERFPKDVISGPQADATLETYVPLPRLLIAPDAAWTPLAVMETYQDARNILLLVRRGTQRAIIQSAAMGLILFGLLFLLVARADRTLRVQHRELTELNATLERRVEARTAQLGQSNADMRRLLNGITDGIAVVTQDFFVESLNDGLREQCDYGDPTWTPQRHCYELYARRTDPCLSCPAQETFASHQPAVAQVTWTINNEHRHFEVTTFPISPARGAGPRVIEYVKDVTERRRSEQHLIQTERLASIGLLAAGVAHEINNPLGSVAHCAAGLRQDLAETGVALRPETREYLDTLESEIHRCKDTTQALLGFARTTPARHTVTDLKALVLHTHALLRFRFTELGVTWAPELPAEDFYAVVDTSKLQQVLFNLLHNALDACGAGGKHITCRGWIAGDEVVLVVEDTGAGMTAEIQQRLFEPFFTTKEPGQGTGLGLSLAYSLVQEMGGRITAESAGPDRGAQFAVHFPVDAA